MENGDADGDQATGRGFSADPAAVRAQLTVLRDHAVTMRAHGTQFQRAAGGLGF